MTAALAVLATAALFVAFGFLARGRPRACGEGCACGAPAADCPRRGPEEGDGA